MKLSPSTLSSRHVQVMLLLIVAFLFLPLDAAWASAGGGSGSGQGNCPGNGLLERLVPCITDAMEQSTTKLANSISTYLFPMISVFVILVIIIYGAKIMSPEGNPRKTAIPVAMKIGFMLLFVQNFGGFIPAVHGGLKEIVDILANALEIRSQCEGASGGGGGGAAASGAGKLWTQMDCILGKLFGFEGKDGNMKLIASIFGLAAGFFFGGSFGMIAFMGILGVLWAVLVFIYKATFAFLNGFLLASFAVIISPLFIPLFLLQVSTEYFQRWLQLFISAFIMPLLVVGYCIFALSIYNKILFESEHAETIRKTMDKAFAEGITGMRTECLGTWLNNIFFHVSGGSGGGNSGGNGGGNSRDANTVLRNDSVQNPVIPQQSGAPSLCIKIPNIDMQQMMDGFKNKQDFFRKIFTDGAGLFLLSWLLLQGLKWIQEVVGNMSGRAAAKLLSPISSIEQRIQTSMKNAEQKMKDYFQRPTG